MEKNKKIRKLNMDIIKSKPSVNISTEEALKDVIPFAWSEKVLNGEKKAEIKLL